jgi:hypothetical protein
MTARTVVAIGSLTAALASAGCLSFYEIPVEVPIQAKIDVSSFQRVLVPGFLTGGSKTIDPNTETVRLLRSQLRTKQDLRVVDADVLSLAVDAAKERSSTPASASAAPASDATPAAGPEIKDEKDLAAYESIFDDAAYWKKIGAEYDSPLIVTGSVLFTELTRSGMVSRTQSVIDNNGQEQFRPIREYSDLKGYALSPKFVFIDGRTGQQLYSETYHEETLYPAGQNTPALSSYFELMDKLLPSLLNTLSNQKIKGTRVLLK